MGILVILLCVTVILTFAAVGPIIGRKLFPPPSSENEFSVMLAYTGGISKGQKIRVQNEDLEVVKVEGSTVTFRRETTSK